MTGVQIILPPRGRDFVSESLRLLTKTICDAHPEIEGSYGLGGEHGYGENFENGVFEMRRFYWGDCDCGYDKREDDWSRAHKHSDDCYQAELRRRRIATGLWEVKPDGQFEWWDINAPYDKRESAEGAIFDDLCAKFGMDRKFGAAVHCTCEHDRLWKAFCDTPEGRHSDTCSLELPNFRHKASGFEVRWYKWIGRDNELKNETVDLGGVFRECIASVIRRNGEPLPEGSE